MEEIKNNYIEKSRYKDEDKRRAYKKNWAREKRMKIKLPKEKTEQENTPLIKNVIIKKRKRPIVQPVVHAGENQAYFYVGFCKLRNFREENNLGYFLDWMTGIQELNMELLEAYEKYRKRPGTVCYFGAEEKGSLYMECLRKLVCDECLRKCINNEEMLKGA
jgi:hypothetical protein